MSEGYPLSFLGFAAFLSLIAGSYLGISGFISPFSLWLAALIGSIFCIGGIKRPKLILPGLIFIMLFFGAWRGFYYVREKAQKPPAGAERGVVRQVKDSGRFQRVSVKLDSGSEGEITAAKYPKLERGMAIEIDFSAKGAAARYLNSASLQWQSAFPDIHITGEDFSLRAPEQIRQTFLRSIERLYPGDAGGFMAGVLIGEQSLLSRKMREAFTLTGASHILVLSGYNITILAFGVGWVLRRFLVSPAVHFALTIGIILLFVLIVGASAPVVRAAILGFLALLAKAKGRKYEINNALYLGAAAMVLQKPDILRYDISFQLSFLATIGLVIAPTKFLWMERWPKLLAGFAETAFASVAAEVFVAPIILFYFSRFSLIGPLVNVAVLPFVPWIMLAGAITVAVDLFFPALAFLLSLPGFLFLSWLLRGVELAAGLPFASLELPPFFALISILPPALLIGAMIARRVRYAI